MVGALRISGWTRIPCFARTLNLVVKNKLQVNYSEQNKVN